MEDNHPMVKVVLRGFLGAIQLVEHTMMAESQEVALEYAAIYLSTEAPSFECDRYTVDTYWVF